MSYSDEAIDAAAAVLYPMLAALRDEERDAKWWDRARDTARQMLKKIDADRADYLQKEAVDDGTYGYVCKRSDIDEGMMGGYD